MPSPAENATTVRRALTQWIPESPDEPSLDRQYDTAIAALAALLAQAEAGDQYRIEADHAHDDYEDAEHVIRQIAETRPNQRFDPWARDLCQAFLDRPNPTRERAEADRDAAVRERDQAREALRQIVALYSDENEEHLADSVYQTARAALASVSPAGDSGNTSDYESFRKEWEARGVTLSWGGSPIDHSCPCDTQDSGNTKEGR